MNNSKLCNILEVGSRVALRQRLEVFWECSQVWDRERPGVTGPVHELVATAFEPSSPKDLSFLKNLMRDYEYIWGKMKRLGIQTRDRSANWVMVDGDV